MQGEVEEGKGEIKGEHTIQCTCDVLWNCAPETCIVLLTKVTPINSRKRKNNASLTMTRQVR